MIIFPAIDLSGGRAVRLLRGDYNKMQVYAENPCEIAQSFLQNGANHLHVVDLDGAKDGTLANYDTIKALAENKSFFIQVGGGIRTEERIEKYLSLGVKRVILGTIAVENFKFTEQMVAKYGDAIAVGVDARDGMVAIKGWLETSTEPSFAFCQKCADIGVKAVIYTDISKDGALNGTNLNAYAQLAQIKGLNIIASGGVTHLSEITTLANARTYGCIVGKALYENVLTLHDCLSAARGGII